MIKTLTNVQLAKAYRGIWSRYINTRNAKKEKKLFNTMNLLIAEINERKLCLSEYM